MLTNARKAIKLIGVLSRTEGCMKGIIWTINRGGNGSQLEKHVIRRLTELIKDLSEISDELLDEDDNRREKGIEGD
jgi:hypothetical protein